SHYRKGFLKQYVRDRFLLRTESATNNISTDYGIGKAVANLPQLRQKLNGIIDRYLEVQQDILETFVDHEELRQLTQPTLLPNGRRIPGLKLDQPRQLALMHSLVRFCTLLSLTNLSQKKRSAISIVDILPSFRRWTISYTLFCWKRPKKESATRTKSSFGTL